MKNTLWLVVLSSVLATGAVMLLVVNLSTGEKEITQRLQHAYRS